MARCVRLYPDGAMTTRLRDAARQIRRKATASEMGRVESPEKWKTRLGKEGEEPIVALGKFDAMHVGHRSLATVASEMGHPWLISFSNMARVMGWDLTRLPIVAEVERPYVLGAWKEACAGRLPHMRYLPFAEIRHQSPRKFVEMLVKDLGAAGVVAGANYRFGYKAAGDAELLEQLAREIGIQVKIVELVSSDNNGSQEKVSSSKVREALADGDMKAVKRLLGRPYTLVLRDTSTDNTSDLRLCPASRFLNQPPRNGIYRVSVGSAATSAEFVEDGVVCPLFSSVSFDSPLRMQFE